MRTFSASVCRWFQAALVGKRQSKQAIFETDLATQLIRQTGRRVQLPELTYETEECADSIDLRYVFAVPRDRKGVITHALYKRLVVDLKFEI